MSKGIVVVIKDNVLDNVETFKDGMAGENLFLQKCSENLSNWDEYTVEDKSTILENGYEKFGNGSICISWF